MTQSERSAHASGDPSFCYRDSSSHHSIGVLIKRAAIVFPACALAWALSAGVAQAAWPSLWMVEWWWKSGLEGGVVTAIAIDLQTPTTIYAAAGPGGVFKSTNGGATWSARNSGFKPDWDSPHCVTSLVIDPSTPTTLYAAGGSGVFKSTNGGTNWTLLPGVWGNVLAIDPLQPATVYAVGWDRVFKTTDGGATWSKMDWTAPSPIEAIVIDPEAPTRIYAGTRFHGVFKTVDAGFTWTSFSTGLEEAHPYLPNLSGLNVKTLAFSPAFRGRIYAGTAAGVFKSTAGGAGWRNMSAGKNFTNISSLATDYWGSTLYVGTSGGVFKSPDGGWTWSALTGTWFDPSAVRSGVRVVAIDPVNPDNVYAGLDGAGIVKTINAGTTWNIHNAGLSAALVTDIAIDPLTPTTLYAVVKGGGIAKSTDNGTSWNTVNTVDTGLTTLYINALAIDPQAPETLYVGTFIQGVLKSTDGGESWTHTNGAGSGLWDVNVYAFAFDPTASATLYAGTSNGVYKSTNGGASWTARSAGLPNVGTADWPKIATVTILAIDPMAPGTLYAGTALNAGLFKSTDGGASWIASSSGLLPNQWVTSLAIDPTVTSTLYVGMGNQGYDGGVFRSTDGGASWTGNTTGFPGVVRDISSLAIDPTRPGTLYAGHRRQVYKSIDGGASLNPTSPLNAYVYTLAFNPQTNTVFAGTAAGLFRLQRLQFQSRQWP